MELKTGLCEVKFSEEYSAVGLLVDEGGVNWGSFETQYCDTPLDAGSEVEKAIEDAPDCEGAVYMINIRRNVLAMDENFSNVRLSLARLYRGNVPKDALPVLSEYLYQQLQQNA